MRCDGRVGILWVVAALSGCRTAGLSEEGAEVGMSSMDAPGANAEQDCKVLGQVVGRGGGAFGGAWVSNDSLVEYALNDLRNQAAELGANHVTHDPPQMGQADGTTTTVTVRYGLLLHQ